MRDQDIRNPKKLTTEIVNQIVNFYEDDSNSRLLPGAKDYISIKTVDGRQHIQTHIMQSFRTLPEMVRRIKIQWYSW